MPTDGTVATVRPSDEELDAPGGIDRVGVCEVFGRQLGLTNPDKVLFPAADGPSPVTKRELIRYAACAAPAVLPYLAGRALNMHRFPDGVDSGGFWHRQLPDHAPDWIARWDYPGSDPGETRTYLVASEPATPVWVANFGAAEWHAWTSCTDQPHLPTFALIDIDPGPATSWDNVLVLGHLGVAGQPKLTAVRNRLPRSASRRGKSRMGEGAGAQRGVIELVPVDRRGCADRGPGAAPDHMTPHPVPRISRRHGHQLRSGSGPRRRTPWWKTADGCPPK